MSTGVQGLLGTTPPITTDTTHVTIPDIIRDITHDTTTNIMQGINTVKNVTGSTATTGTMATVTITTNFGTNVMTNTIKGTTSVNTRSTMLEGAKNIAKSPQQYIQVR